MTEPSPHRLVLNLLGVLAVALSNVIMASGDAETEHTVATLAQGIVGVVLTLLSQFIGARPDPDTCLLRHLHSHRVNRNHESYSFPQTEAKSPPMPFKRNAQTVASFGCLCCSSSTACRPCRSLSHNMLSSVKHSVTAMFSGTSLHVGLSMRCKLCPVLSRAQR